MNSLFKEADVSEITKRIDRLAPDTKNHWGKMNVSQMLAHCNKSLETAMGEKPFGKNSPTDKSYIFKDPLNFEEEKRKLKTSLTKFFEGGPSNSTKYPHPFFGKFTEEEWGVFTWKHLDHHLRQFGV